MSFPSSFLWYMLAWTTKTVQDSSMCRSGPAPPSGEHHMSAGGKLRIIEQSKCLVDLLVGDEPGADRLLSNLLEVGLNQACTGSSALPYSQVALHAHIHQALRP